MPAVYPGPALPNVQQWTIAPGEIEYKETSVYALETAADDVPAGSLTVAQRVARRDLMYVLDELRKPRGGPPPYPVAAVAVLSVPYTRPDGPARAPVAWPGPALPGDPIGPGGQVGCVTVTGDAATAVLAAAAEATAATPWTSAGTTWSLRFRPLLPGESGCAEIARQR